MIVNKPTPWMILIDVSCFYFSLKATGVRQRLDVIVLNANGYYEIPQTKGVMRPRQISSLSLTEFWMIPWNKYLWHTVTHTTQHISSHNATPHASDFVVNFINDKQCASITQGILFASQLFIFPYHFTSTLPANLIRMNSYNLRTIRCVSVDSYEETQLYSCSQPFGCIYIHGTKQKISQTTHQRSIQIKGSAHFQPL